MTPFQLFMTNKPNPPEHAEYMALAAKRYPGLPPGAQQAALHCFETRGPKAAARYASNARARHPIPKPWVCPKQGNRGVCTLTKKARAERAECLERLRLWHELHAVKRRPPARSRRTRKEERIAA